MSIVVYNPDILLRIIGTLKDAVRAAEHLVPLAPVFNEVAVGIDHINDVGPLEINARLSDVEIIARGLSIRSKECSRRTGRCCITPRKPSDWKFNARSELSKRNRFRSLDVGQLTALQDEHAIGT